MLLVSPAEAERISDLSIRGLVLLRFAQVCAGEPYDPERHGTFAVIEPGDSVDEFERQTGCPVLHDTFFEVRFGDPDFVPAAEVIEDHGDCWELVYVLSDHCGGILLFVPNVDGVNPELLAMCATYATPVTEASPR